MTRFGRLLRTVVEKLSGNFYEGPEPPKRFAQQVAEFARLYPNATVDEWAQMAVRLACAAYRAGYVRGFEWAERDLDKLDLGDPDMLAESMARDWEWHDSRPTEFMRKQVQGDFLDALTDDAQRAAYLDLLGRYHGRFRIVVEPVPGNRKTNRK